MGGGSYPSAEMQSVYSTAPADRAKFFNRDHYWIVSLVLNNNTWNHLIVYKEIIYHKKNF